MADGKPLSQQQALARRNLRTALWLGLVALGFVVAFFWSMSHRGG
ncbi:MAG TPA: hypothetical protein VFA75_16440 [Nevskia sp.]|jgi:hypothetical protein|nr:hypothetical protein [Nevskia sp.]